MALGLPHSIAPVPAAKVPPGACHPSATQRHENQTWLKLLQLAEPHCEQPVEVGKPVVQPPAMDIPATWANNDGASVTVYT